jgi:carbamoyl-phosphate synthase small subunit
LTHPALLALEDGSVFYGVSIGARGQSVGEVVFNTAVTGYQEILTDPSYFQQIVTLTYPHIGNVGANADDEESPRVYASGLVIRDVPKRQSNWRSEGLLGDYLEHQGVVAIAGIDTCRLVRILREGGAQRGSMMAGEGVDAGAALCAARLRGSRRGRSRKGGHHSPSECLGRGQPEAQGSQASFCTGGSRRVFASSDRLRLRRQAQHPEAPGGSGCRLTVVPCKTPASEVLGAKPDGVFLSNGPGDPAACDYAITAIREIVETGCRCSGVLPRVSAPGARLWRPHRQDEVRPPSSTIPIPRAARPCGKRAIGWFWPTPTWPPS